MPIAESRRSRPVTRQPHVRASRSYFTKRAMTFRLFLVLGMVVTVGPMIVLNWRLGVPKLAAYLIGVNFATLCAYLYDKLAAIRDFRRIPESVMQLLAAVGGSPAAIVSQSAFRHKTIKGSFRRRFWTIFTVQVVVVLAWLFIAQPWT